ncbi:MAG: Uma2 family endonuclease [Candidatus Omnitrophota bacterium]
MSAQALRIEDLPHYTYEDYAQWKDDWELIRGIPYAMVPAPLIGHQRISSRIDRQLSELLDDCSQCESLCAVDWQITEDTVVRPDVLVVCHENKDIGIIKLEKTPIIVFEILSPSTRRKDRGIKYQLYEKAGVTYYCMVDPESKSADVFLLQPQKETYQPADPFQDGMMTFDLGPCRIRFDFGKIFKTI